MKDRIMQIMKTENMTQQEFAQTLDLSPASLSSIFNGRTNPTNNHVQAIHRCFPNINVNWLMFGEGEMYCDPQLHSPSLPTQKNVSSSSGILDETTGGSSDDSIYNKERLANSGEINLSQDRIEDHASCRTNSIAAEVNSGSQIIRETIKYIDKPQRKITEIRIFFDDGTYEVFSK